MQEFHDRLPPAGLDHLQIDVIAVKEDDSQGSSIPIMAVGLNGNSLVQDEPGEMLGCRLAERLTRLTLFVRDLRGVYAYKPDDDVGGRVGSS
jgi:hypothetical protein